MDPFTLSLVVGTAVSAVGGEINRARDKKEAVKQAAASRGHQYAKNKKIAKELDKADKLQSMADNIVNTSTNQRGALVNQARASTAASAASRMRNHAEVVAEKQQMKEDAQAYRKKVPEKYERISKDFLPGLIKPIAEPLLKAGQGIEDAVKRAVKKGTGGALK